MRFPFDTFPLCCPLSLLLTFPLSKSFYVPDHQSSRFLYFVNNKTDYLYDGCSHSHVTFYYLVNVIVSIFEDSNAQFNNLLLHFTVDFWSFSSGWRVAQPVKLDSIFNFKQLEETTWVEIDGEDAWSVRELFNELSCWQFSIFSLHFTIFPFPHHSF